MTKQLLITNSGLSKSEWKTLQKLSTPTKIQDFLNSLKFDHEVGEKIDRTVKGVLSNGKTDCAGGAIFAAAALWCHGHEPFLMDLKATKPDFDHVVAVFKEGKKFGAISKTNHAVLRYREPLYESVRELAMSYFHEYFLPNGKKTLRSFSRPLNLKKYSEKWLSNNDLVQEIIYDLDNSMHIEILNKDEIRKLRLADKIEIKAGEIVEY